MAKAAVPHGDFFLYVRLGAPKGSVSRPGVVGPLVCLELSHRELEILLAPQDAGAGWVAALPWVDGEDAGGCRATSRSRSKRCSGPTRAESRPC
jgi:hypothetical protein